MTKSNIASAINAAHAGVEAAKREGARYAVECGRLLIQAKETIPHGGWDGWLRLNTKVSPRTAQLYMRIARHVEADPAKAQRVAGLSVREAAAEAVGTRRQRAVTPLPPEGEAWLSEFKSIWDEAKDKPAWKEGFAREMHERGEITLQQRNAIIQAAYQQADADPEEAAKRAVDLLAKHMTRAQLVEIADTIRRQRLSGPEIALAIGDVMWERQRGARSPRA